MAVKILEINGNIIENRHTGIATMIDEMIKMNLPAPKFESLRGDFKVTFWKELDEEDRTEQNNSGQKWTEVDRSEQIEMFEKLDDKIFYLIQKNPKITQAQMCKKLSVGRTAITNHIRKLKQTKIVERIGSDRNGYWKINKRI